METTTIYDKKTTVKTIVRKKAESSDLDMINNVYLVPNDGGHIAATHLAKIDNRFYFQSLLYPYDSMAFSSLENIYVL